MTSEESGNITLKRCPCERDDRASCSEHGHVKQVIVIRRDLGMRRGKEIAQGAHASMAWLAVRMRPFTRGFTQSVTFTEAEKKWVNGSFRKVVCQVRDEPALRALVAAARERSIEAHLIMDAGLTEFHGVLTATAAAVGPAWESDVDVITRKLDLY